MTYEKELIEKFSKLANDNSDTALSELISCLEKKSNHTIKKHIIPYLASRALIMKGRVGIDTLVKLIDTIDGFIYPSAIVETLWLAGEGKFSNPLFISNTILNDFNFEISKDIQTMAKDAFLSFILKAHSNPESFYKLINFLYSQNNKTLSDENQHKNFHKRIFSILSETSIKISQNIITSFEEIIEQNLKEENYQLFFEQNPVLIDPWATTFLDKHRLGSDLITDFVVETLKKEYILIEIEKPQDNLFTAQGYFSTKFSHAFGQVIDFIDWVENNIAYAQTKLPGISSPKGILIIGRSKFMTEEESRKLKRFNKNSNTIEVLTYDDILHRAKSLYSNIKRQIGLKDT